MMNEQGSANTHLISNALNLHHSLDFLKQVFEVRIRLRFEKKEDGADDNHKSLELAYYKDGSVLANFINSAQPSFDEYVILLLALAPRVRPNFLDQVIKKARPNPATFPRSAACGTRRIGVFSQRARRCFSCWPAMILASGLKCSAS